MQQKVIIAIDSFKGCLSSQEAGEAVASGIRQVCPDCQVRVVPVADGGEGLLEALVGVTGGSLVSCRAHGPLMEVRDTCYGLSGDGRTAFIEMARISGLPLVPEERRNPLLTTTYGTGELMADALRRGCKRVLIGLGGSATNDAGMGMLQALGFRFLDETGADTGLGGQALERVERVDASGVMAEVREATFIAACDVHNPLHGPEGAACIFAPQKGATPEMVDRLDKGLHHFAEVVRLHTGTDISSLPGAGASGGMGGGLSAFLHADLRPGIELVLAAADFPALLHDASLVITGEGRADRQTLMGKVPAGILEEARRHHVPVILLAGQVADEAELLQAGFKEVRGINPPSTPLSLAMCPDFARRQLTATCATAIAAFR